MLSSILNEKNANLFDRAIRKVCSEQQYDDVVYQICGLLIKNDKKNLKQLIDTIKQGKIMWQSEMFNDYKFQLNEQDDFSEKPFEVANGVVSCHKCNSKKTWSIQRQTRASDEPMTTFTTCSECGHQQTYSG